MARRSRAQTRTPLLLAALWFAAAQPAAAKERLTGELVRPASAGPVYALVELSEQPTAVTYALQARTAGRLAAARTAAVSQLARVQVEQDALRRQVTAAHLAGTKEIYGLKRVFNGVVFRTDEKALAALRGMQGVKAVHRLTPMVPDNAVAVPLVGALQVWSNSTPFDGEGIRVGVIDTGIDYTHANFGGPGTVDAYNDIDKNAEHPFDPAAKVAGGVDLAGENYDASDPDNSTPVPDKNPLDGAGHGSHVAGTIAGYGVTRDGATYEGPWDSTLDPRTLAIGPGAAPAASLYAIKVFGDEGGSTVLSYAGLEWALDPNGDGYFDDRLDIVNLSLGAPFGTANDAESGIFANAVDAGMVVVASAGNEGDAYFITGTPGSIPAVVSVAATQDGADPALQVNAPSSLAGRKAVGLAKFGPAIATPITADVVAAAPYDACAELTNPAALAGKIALVQRGGACGFLAKTQAAEAAGAVGVIVVNTNDSLLTMVGDDPGLTITARIVIASDGAAIKAALDAGTPVNATLSDALGYTPSVDLIADFSSRGPTRLGGDIVLKPDVAAPGQAIFSTAVGTGTGGFAADGTSMAAPLATGVMALLAQARADHEYGPAELKALLMNTAGHDVFDRPSTDPDRQRAGPGRVGAGRIDAAAAVASTVIAYDRDAPGRVSVSFRTKDVDRALTETRTIRLSGIGGGAVKFTPSIDLAVTTPGTTVSVPGAPITIGESGGWADVEVTLSADPAQMTRVHDPTLYAGDRRWMSETSGWVVFTPQGGGQPLRVPFYAALTPASQMSSTGHLVTRCESSGTASLVLAGTGIDTTAGAPPPEGVISLVTPFELAWSSPQEDVGPWNNASIQHVGVTSNLPDAGNLLNSEIYFGITTYGVWGNLAEMDFQVLLKRRSSPTWEYLLFIQDLANGGGFPVTGLHKLGPYGAVPEDFVNGLPATGHFLPAYLTDTVVLPVYAVDLGLADGGETAIDFQVAAFSSYGDDEPTTQSPVLHYDLARPAFAVGADPSLGLAGKGAPPLWADTPGTSIPVAFDIRRQVNPASGMLLIHHHNAAGMRAEVVQAVCMPEPTSKSGCASLGGGALPSLLALGALLLRRKRRR